MGATVGRATLGDGEITERTTESATLAKALETVLDILDVCIRNGVTSGSSDMRKGFVIVRKSSEEEMILKGFHLDTLYDVHLPEGDTLWAVTARGVNKLTGAIVEIPDVTFLVGLAIVRILDENRVKTHT